eukprot:m.459570 g.459570  ORF g.459570 m.459570 type:complete len:185 (+) comp21583_c0_seq22:208-762(+)
MAGIGFEEREGGIKNLTARLTGESVNRVGTCKKCGFAGHLAYQCRNTVKAQTLQGALENEKQVDTQVTVDVSSTSSEESDDSILKLDSDISSDDEPSKARMDVKTGKDFFGRDMAASSAAEKQKKKKKHKSKDRKRRHTPDTESESDDDGHREKPKLRKRKKEKKSKSKKSKKSKSKKHKKDRR